MEDKTLTTEQSLDLIARMITNTRQNFNDRGGAMFLVWGYTTIAVTIAVTVLFYLTRSYNVMWAWWAVPLIGSILTWLHFRKQEKSVTTHLDKTVQSVWQVVCIVNLIGMAFIFLVPIFTGKQPFNVIFTFGLIVSIATAITGRIIKFKPVFIGGIAGILISFVISTIGDSNLQMSMFAAVILVTLVIPGHLLNAACKREIQERRAA